MDNSISNSQAAAKFPGNTVRVDWVDYAKGFCIIMVVMMHSTLGVGKASGETGWMHLLVEFARPFRMPDFFMISGLFLASVIDRPWRRYFDRKVVHFFYFYLLWVTIQFAFKAPAWISQGQTPVELINAYLMTFVQPFGTLWFIYILPVFFLAARFTERFDWRIVLGLAIVLEMLPIHTGSVIIDEFAARFAYFYAGYKLAPVIFRLAHWALANSLKAIVLLSGWALLNGFVVFAAVPDLLTNMVAPAGFTPPASLADYPGISVALGGLGAVAVILTATLLSKLSFTGFLKYLGANSIVVYLAFFLPMGISRVILLNFAPFLDIGTVSLLVTISGVVGAVIIYWLSSLTGYGGFLFRRPNWALTDKPVEIFQEKAAV